jgi:hypothetical protein
LSVYVTHEWNTGDNFNEAAVDAWDARIDNAFAAHEVTLAGLQDSIDALANALGETPEGRVSVLENLIQKVPTSPNASAISSADDYTLDETDIGTEIITRVNNAAKTYTLNNITSTAGDCIFITNAGTGMLTIHVGSGVTLRSPISTVAGPGDLDVTSTIWSLIRLRKVSAGIWQCNGDLG